MDPNFVKHMLSIALAHYGARNPVGLQNYAQRMGQLYHGVKDPYFHSAISAMSLGDIPMMSHYLNQGVGPYIPSP